MPLTPLNFPTLVKRLVKGSELTFAEGDQNLDSIRGYCIALANLLASSLNPDGTLVPGSVGSQALQAAAVTLASLNPSLLYSIVPVDTDTGSANAYAITARGGLGGVNVVPGGAVYDSNGNYSITGLTLNYGYFWTKGGDDASVVVDSSTTLSSSGAFTATLVNVTLKGTPNSSVTATLALSAPVSSYKDYQLFLVYTESANTTASTLNVNGLGAIPILSNGQSLTPNQIGTKSVFIVMYLAGKFVLFGSGGAGGGDLNISYTFQGNTVFSSGSVPLPGSGVTFTIAHGFGELPATVTVLLKKTATDATDADVAIGQYVAASEFLLSGQPAFTVSFDETSISVTQATGTSPELNGTAITESSWVLIIQASHVTNVSSTVFPALTYTISNPECAFAYGDRLFTISRGTSSAKGFITAINLSDNSVVPLTNVTNIWSVNAAIFLRADGTLDAVWGQAGAANGSSATWRRMPLTNPADTIVPAFATYDGAGLYVLSLTSGATYTWTKGASDTDYSNDGGANYVSTTPDTFVAAAATVILRGAPGASITAVVNQPGAWASVALSAITTATGLFYRKPVQITEAGGAITEIYAVTSNYSTNNSGGKSDISALNMTKYTTSLAASVGSALDLTNAGIVNVAQFNNWHPSTSTAQVLLFQYNPVSNRIYVITNEIGLVHIFKITAAQDIKTWWASGSRYTDLTYEKSIALSGDGAAWTLPTRCNFFVEFDMVTGVEKSIVFARGGDALYAGSVTRVPWVG